MAPVLGVKKKWNVLLTPGSSLRLPTSANSGYTIEGLLASLLPYNVHTFSAKGGHWVEPGGRRWMVLPGYDEEELPEVDSHE